MIRMTWRDYLRRECLFFGRRVHLSPQERCVLSTLLLHRGCPVTTGQMIEELWPNPDIEPDWALKTVHVLVRQLRVKLPGLIRLHSARRDGVGYVIDLPEQERRLAA